MPRRPYARHCPVNVVYDGRPSPPICRARQHVLMSKPRPQMQATSLAAWMETGRILTPVSRSGEASSQPARAGARALYKKGRTRRVGTAYSTEPPQRKPLAMQLTNKLFLLIAFFTAFAAAMPAAEPEAPSSCTCSACHCSQQRRDNA
ncbi:hypothetical protein OH76DRAFT_854442 [Lentinus brumalis]|uniref:Uncharacterized protein n=1 Tax=Lentinus brumalis TaxID=2498619 RepID=A0A371DR52_9APHY|nr:hypothetical protein OH76DRAFT_854442 [Polyporus brumalis]